MAPVYATVRRLAGALPAEVALIGYAGAPWTVASYMVEGRGGAASDYTHVKRFAFGDPAGFQRLIDLLVRVTTSFLIRQVREGGSALQAVRQAGQSAACAVLHRWCVAPVAAIVAG